MLPVEKKNHGLLLYLYVQPKAAKNQFAGIYNGAAKIRITAPPADNKANKMCVRFLAKQLGIPQSSIELVAGKTSRSKQVVIAYKSPETREQEEKQLLEKLSALLS
ncbi:MAG: DUF167 domain-containing protein [Desulfosalsimonadaceae bacterium]